jgi:O-antigen/teichoic acid export membrane protein
MALLRHSGIYFLARILAGAAGFALIAAYTRLLSAQEFGELALAMAGVVFFSVLIVEGSMLAMLRSLPEHPAAARATALWGLILPAAALCCVAATIFLIAAPERWRLLLALCAGLLLASLLHQFQLASAQGTLRPGRYALIGGLESLLDMTLGISLVWLGYGVAGALLGTMLASLITVAINVRGWWVNWTFFDPVLARQMARFGLPLIAAALFGWLATFADRWLLGLFLGTGQAGLYAAGYDLQMNLLGVPLLVMALAGYPLTIGAYSERGVPAAQTQLRLLGTFIILIVLPEAVGVVMTGPLLVNIFLGEEFRPLTLSLLPILISATFLKALMLYMNYGYVLAGRTGLTLLAMASAAAVDIALNVILIPHYGAVGAAAAALIGFGAGFAISVIKMRGVFPFPLPDPAILSGGLIGAAAMAAWLWPFHHVTAWSAAFYVIPVAIVVYFGAVFLFLHFTGRKPLELLRGLWQSETNINAKPNPAFEGK